MPGDGNDIILARFIKSRALYKHVIIIDIPRSAVIDRAADIDVIQVGIFYKGSIALGVSLAFTTIDIYAVCSCF